jgi:hypothetical protein
MVWIVDDTVGSGTIHAEDSGGDRRVLSGDGKHDRQV